MMLWGGVLPSLLAVPVVTVAVWAARGEQSALSALLGAVVVFHLFFLGFLALKLVMEHLAPVAALPGALGIYSLQVGLMLAVMAVLSEVDGLDGRALGIAGLVVGLAWMAGQVAGFLLARQPTLDVRMPSSEADQ